MGTKYSTNTISSYNASPPADDGSTAASNQITWAKHKTKLADPIKTLAEAINTDLVTALNQSAIQKTDTYSILAAEHDKTVEFLVTSAGADAILLDAATAAAGYLVTVSNAFGSTANITAKLATATDLLNSTTNGSIAIPPDCSLTFIVNPAATGYNVVSGHALSVGPDGGAAHLDSGGVSPGITRIITVPDTDVTLRTDLNNLTEDTDPDLGADFVETYDDSASANKKVLLHRLNAVLGTSLEASSGTSLDFTSLPSWINRITVIFRGVSTNGDQNLMIQLGDSGGIETDGYVSTSDNGATQASTSAGCLVTSQMTSAGASIVSGHYVLTKVHTNDNTWVGSGVVKRSTGQCTFAAADKTLSGTLDRIRITTVSGADAFDAGTVNILYE